MIRCYRNKEAVREVTTPNYGDVATTTILARTVPRIGAHSSQVLQVDLAQAALQLLGHTQIDGELVGRELVHPRVDGEEERQDLVHGGPQRLEEQQECDDGRLDAIRVIEPKRCVEVGGSITQREAIERCADR